MNTFYRFSTSSPRSCLGLLVDISDMSDAMRFNRNNDETVEAVASSRWNFDFTIDNSKCISNLDAYQ